MSVRRAGAAILLTVLSLGAACTRDGSTEPPAGGPSDVRDFDPAVARSSVRGRVRFDYHLREGVVQRSNALALMREVGLEV